ncbi:helix-turn-helix transcriptional regulator [Desulfomonile tiedjei]|uniref:DNA-binding domain-containing protein, AraC-type n=1 Tax=Desulfomonile tiedjei (strain ATCC 49306 / DSM 6799 / DCB-1) TaxID=706587 RepID=I4C0V7_DESTA|nr:AraC family transcriptional regulator [Desulfomonile tiedjei]AFM23198.1 DNA-binding domain-containing protein, AraC-type [Desulfomonile tiedjei DSM 6799]
MGLNSRSLRFKMSFLDLIEFSQEAGWVDPQEMGALGRYRASIQHEQMWGISDGYILRPGLTISYVDLYLAKDTELSLQLSEPAVAFGSLIEASGTRGIIDGKGITAEARISSRINMVSVVQGKEWILRLAGGQRHRMFRIQITKQIIRELIGEYDEMIAGPLRHILSSSSSAHDCLQENLTATGEYLAYQILQCPLEGVARRLFMESKALEMIAYELEEFSGNVSGAKVIRNLQETERLYRAKSILEAEFVNPPALFQLSRRIGLNDFKLKAGFREVFGNTVFGYVRQLRMEKARALLEGSDLSVTQIALEVGYNSFGHFAAAFRKSFGIPPSQYRRTRNCREMPLPWLPPRA